MEHINRTLHDVDLRLDLSEMAIVDVFTRLIFSAPDDSVLEARVVEALRRMYPVECEGSAVDIGAWLRALGVREMIKLVGRVRTLVLSSDQGSDQGSDLSADPGGRHH